MGALAVQPAQFWMETVGTSVGANGSCRRATREYYRCLPSMYACYVYGSFTNNQKRALVLSDVLQSLL